MKIAYLISSYLDPIQLKKLILALKYDNKCDFYIHIDKKVDIKQFLYELGNEKNIFFVENRIRVCWGGYSQVNAILSMIELMISTEKKYDRVVSITGLDYPIYSNKKIQEEFKSNKQYMIGLNVIRCNLKKQKRKIVKYWFFDHNVNNRLIVQIISKLENVFFSALPVRKKSSIKIDNTKYYDVYFSSDYWALTYDCVLNLYNEYINNNKIQKYFKHAFAPSELFMATMLFNSKYSKNATVCEIENYTNLASLT